MLDYHTSEIITPHDPDARANARELVQSLMDLHGAGIERMLETIANTGPSGMEVMNTILRRLMNVTSLSG